MKMADGHNRRGFDAAVINSLMMRFRPIAPKPATGEPCYSAIDSISKARPKRKKVGRRRNGGRGGNRRGELPKSDADHEVATDTMQSKVSVPVKVVEEEPSKVTEASQGRPAAKNSSSGSSSCSLMKSWREDERARPASRVIPRTPSLLPDLNTVGSPSPPPDPTGETPQPQRKRVLETWLIVESVATDTRSIHGVAPPPQQQHLGHTITDEERLRGLAGDTSPGFVTDGYNLIRWVNRACERMVRQRLATAGEGLGKAAVWMVAKEDLPYSCPAFTCRVRILYSWQEEGCPMWWQERRGVIVAPCDAWRLDSGGFAWRLDIEAALSLGR